MRARLAGHTVFVDMDVLRPGDVWRSVLYHELAECHAAIVLLNKEALLSPWVKREVNILLWRYALGSPLMIVPALLGTVTTEKIKEADMGELESFQFARSNGRLTSQQMASAIVERFAGCKLGGDQSPMAEWITAVTTYLNEVRSEDSIAAAAVELGIEKDLLRTLLPREGRRFLANQLLGQSQDYRLCTAISKISRYTPREWLDRLVEQTAPTWVDGEAASGLLPMRRPPGVVLLNARLPLTARHYVLRATCCAEAGFQSVAVSAIAGEQFSREFQSECERAIRSLLHVPDGFDHEPLLPKSEEKPKEVCFLIVDPANTPMPLVVREVREVRVRYPWLTVVLLTGEVPPAREKLAEWKLTDAVILSPPLDENAELGGQQMVRQLRSFATAHRGSGALI